MAAPCIKKALLQYPLGGTRKWLTFDSPKSGIVANELDDVPEAIHSAEQAAAHGNWVVGMVSYDASPAFDNAIKSARLDRVPLVSFGVFDSPRITTQPVASGGYEVGPWVSNRSHSAYLTSVRTIRELIAAGETYQVNHTIRLRSSFFGYPYGLFADLVRAQRSDHAAYLDLGDRFVCSASPELFICRTGSHLESRPMKGTIGRHPDPDWDALAANHLRRSEKDLAENTMIVDMVRNDLGRIANLGSVNVSELHSVETYPTVHTMTSTVVGKSDAGLFEIFTALFPAASITGAPKVRTSQIIEALEGDGRGIYTGAIGAIAPDGSLEFNVAIRTGWIDSELGQAEYGVGGGIVWDSDPHEEWREVKQKSRVLERARSDFKLLETMAWTPGDGVFLRDRHIDRLQKSAAHFGIQLSLRNLEAELDNFSADGPRCLRLLCALDGSIELQASLMPNKSSTPWKVPLDSQPVQSEHEFLFHKTTVRDVYEAARQRFPNAPDVLLWNEVGEITETTTGNLVIELGHRLLTPPVKCGLLPGTFRAELLEQGIAEEAIIRPNDLAYASSIWMVNSLRSWIRLEVDFSPISDSSNAVIDDRA